VLSDIARQQFASHFTWVGPLLSATLDESVAVSISAGELPGFPLVMANRAFEAMTGYTAGEVLGRNCRLLQCTETEPHVLNHIVDSLRR
jgi:PAS domain S-box-containing protein